MAPLRASQSGIESSRAQETTVREESVMLVVSQYLGSQRAAADVEAASRASIWRRPSTTRRPTCRRMASAPASTRCAPMCNSRMKSSA